MGEFWDYTEELPEVKVPKKPQINAKVSEQEYIDFTIEAEKLGISRSEFARNCMLAHFAE